MYGELAASRLEAMEDGDWIWEAEQMRTGRLYRRWDALRGCNAKHGRRERKYGFFTVGAECRLLSPGLLGSRVPCSLQFVLGVPVRVLSPACLLKFVLGVHVRVLLLHENVDMLSGLGLSLF